MEIAFGARADLCRWAIQQYITMDSATISALAALSGAVIGDVTSFGTSWLSQQTQAKV